MHDSTKADLVARLQRFTPDERAELMNEAAHGSVQDAAMEATASALGALVAHHQPKKEA